MAVFTILTDYSSYDPPLAGTYPSIEAALLDALAGDTIVLGPNYGPEVVTITTNDITIYGTRLCCTNRVTRIHCMNPA